MYSARGAAARELERRAMRALLLALALLGALLALPSSVSRQSQAVSTVDTADERAAAGSTATGSLRVIRDANAEPVRRSATRASSATVYTPAIGTAQRSAVLAGVRRATGIRNLFRVEHMTLTGTWAFVRAEELAGPGDALRGTGREVAALLVRDDASSRAWRVVELWTRASGHPYASFDARVRALASERRLPSALFARSR